MAHFFKFHTLADIKEECARLGAGLAFSEELSPLFTPLEIGPLRVGNRLCIQPMEGCDGDLEGRPGELTLRRYERFGAGGAKLIWGEAAAVVPEGRANPRQLWLHVGNAVSFEAIVNRCRQAHRNSVGSDQDLVIGLQLTHSGRHCFQKPILARHDPLLDPRTIVDRATRRYADDSTPLADDDYLARLVDRYVEAARLAHQVGFQFVDIKQCHGYLLNELLGARSRAGRYGGSFDNRTRLARDIFTAIRAEAPGLWLASRINVFDGVPFRKNTDNDQGSPCLPEGKSDWGWGVSRADPLEPDLTEPLEWISQMHKLGVGLVNVSLGNPYTSPHYLRPFEYPPPDGYAPPEHPLIGVGRHGRLTGQVQKHLPALAVVGSGYSYLQEYLPYAGAANVERGLVSLVGVGRASLPQPDLALMLLRGGKLDRRRVCRTFSYCTALMRSKHNEMGQFATGCPPFDKEVYGPIWEEARRKAATDGHG